MNYPNNLMCQWHIRPGRSNNVTVKFHFFDTEAGYDFVQLYDSDGKKLEEYSGSLTKDKNKSGTFVSVIEQLNVMNVTITMATDKSYRMKGFNATYSVGKILFFFSSSFYNIYKIRSLLSI